MIIIIKHVIRAASDVLEMVCGKKFTDGKAYIHKRTIIDNAVAVILGLTGQITGQVIIRFTEENAKKVASIMMMGMPVEELDDMALSALSELGNMILGSASTNLAEAGILTDITPPAILHGSVQIKQDYAETVTIPLTADDIRITLDITLKNNNSTQTGDV